MFDTLVDMANEVLSENIVDITKYLGSKFSEKVYQPLVNKYIQKIKTGKRVDKERLANEYMKACYEPLVDLLANDKNISGDVAKIISRSFVNLLNNIEQTANRKIKWD